MQEKNKKTIEVVRESGNGEPYGPVHGIESHCMVWSHEVTCFDLDFQRHALAAT